MRHLEQGQEAPVLQGVKLLDGLLLDADPRPAVVEDMDHFVKCVHYETKCDGMVWKNIIESNVETQNKIAQINFGRQVERERILDILQGGEPRNIGSGAPGDISTVEQCSSNVSE